MDQDAFFVSVEVNKDSSLSGNLVIIGVALDRALVASCSYESRKFGIHSAISSRIITDYNSKRPHESLEFKTPLKYRAEWGHNVKPTPIELTSR